MVEMKYFVRSDSADAMRMGKVGKLCGLEIFFLHFLLCHFSKYSLSFIQHFTRTSV